MGVVNDPAGRPNNLVQVGQTDRDEYEGSDAASGDLSRLSKADLVALAAERGVEHDAKATKADLVDLLSASDDADGDDE